MEAANDLLEKYKRHPFAKGLLPFRSTLNVIGKPFSRVAAKQDGRQRWLIIDTKTGEPAFFSHAALLSQCDNIETGNFVPPNEDIPAGVELKNVQRRANGKCFYTYILDTFSDISLYEGQWVMDDYMKTLPGFNPGDLPRRPYLSGQDPRYRTRFWMQTPMFLRRGAEKDHVVSISHLHPWVVEADRQSKIFCANPDRPRIWMKEGGDIVPIKDRDPGTLERGDILAFSFTVTYHMTSLNWFPQFHPVDIVVVRAGDGDPTDYSSPTIGLYSRPPPAFMDEDQHDGATEGPGELVVVEGTSKLGEVAGGRGGIVEEEGVSKGNGGVSGPEDKEEGGEGRRSTDTLGSFGESNESVVEGFVLVDVGGIEGGEGKQVAGVKRKQVEEEYPYNRFVDVVAEEEGKSAMRAGGGKSGRGGRKRG